MTALHETLASLAGWLWPAAIDHLWQSTCFAALACGVVLLARRAPARVRHAVWLVAAAKFLLPSQLLAWAAAGAGLDALWPFRSGAGEGAAFVYLFAEPAAATVAAGPAPAHAELYCALTLAWLLGTTALAAVWARRRREARGVLAEGRETFAGREFDTLERARRRLGLARDVRLVLTSQRVEPGVWGTRRPTVVLPEAVAEHLNDEELEAVLLHELVHVERRDNLWGNWQTALACLYWFHPLVWLCNRRLLEERELACDERVLETGSGAGPYASGILKVVRFCCGWRVAGVAGVAAGTNLRRRIEEIMRGHDTGKRNHWQRALPPALVVAALAFTAAAGLAGRGARAALVTAETAAGEAADGAPQRVEVRDIQSPAAGRAAEEIRQAPEAALHFENPADSPLAIVAASARVVTREQLRRAAAEGSGIGAGYEDGQPDAYVTLPSVTVTNVSDKTVTEVGLGYERDGRTRVMTGQPTQLRPGETRTFHSEWGRRNVVLEGTAAGLTLRPVWATFEDGRQWGLRKSPPPPPPPPAPPLPGRAAAPDADAAGEGEGAGVGGAASAGAGSGAGSGSGGGTAVGGGSGSGGGAAAGSGAAVGGPIRGGILNQKVISLPQPNYPEIARAARAQGQVAVEVTIDEEGHVISARAVRGHPLLQTAAVEAARQARFSPTRLSGQPVKVSGILTYNFTIDE